jgi:glutaconyl-CoA decarboxylase
MATYTIKHEGKDYEVTVEDVPGGGGHVTVEGRTFEVEPLRAAVAAAPAGAAPAAPPPPRPAAAPAGGSGTIQAPIPGVITKLLVKAGDTVQANQVVLRLEAMKIENDIATPVGGTVKEVAVTEGAEVKDGQLLMVVG